MPRTRLFKKKGPRRKSKPHHGEHHWSARSVVNWEEKKKRLLLDEELDYIPGADIPIAERDEPLPLRQRKRQDHFLDLSEPRGEYIAGAPQVALSPLARGTVAHVALAPRKPIERHKISTLVSYSAEVVNHANYLLNSEGRAAMEKYLKGVKDMNTNSGTAPGPVEARRDVPTTVIPGGLEAELQQAEQKARHYRAESERSGAEADRHEELARRLRELLDLKNSPVVLDGRKSRSNGKTDTGYAHKGYWPEKMRSLFADRKPRTRKEMANELHSATGKQRASISAAVNSAVRKDFLVEITAGRYGLAAWTHPGGAA